MATEKYNPTISKTLPIDVEISKNIPAKNIPKNYYPHYIVGKSTKIAEKPWNVNRFTMNYNVTWESKSRLCGYPKKIGISFRIYRDGDYIARCYVKYNTNTGEIYHYNVRYGKEHTADDIAETDLLEFIENVIQLFKELAHNEYIKANDRDENNTENEEDDSAAYAYGTLLNDDDSDNGNTEKEKPEEEKSDTEKSDKEKYTNEKSGQEETGEKKSAADKKYVAVSWQKHGYYRTKEIYVKSHICSRNKSLF